ncbi:hypothetical protein HanIR_Chr07g0331221 [Helianthus annuus]|nr:hypothetical protein HanIR_Chr07g0331221 [Helianthus annuus]
MSQARVKNQGFVTKYVEKDNFAKGPPLCSSLRAFENVGTTLTFCWYIFSCRRRNQETLIFCVLYLYARIRTCIRYVNFWLYIWVYSHITFSCVQSDYFIAYMNNKMYALNSLDVIQCNVIESLLSHG